MSNFPVPQLKARREYPHQILPQEYWSKLDDKQLLFWASVILREVHTKSPVWGRMREYQKVLEIDISNSPLRDRHVDLSKSEWLELAQWVIAKAREKIGDNLRFGDREYCPPLPQFLVDILGQQFWNSLSQQQIANWLEVTLVGRRYGYNFSNSIISAGLENVNEDLGFDNPTISDDFDSDCLGGDRQDINQLFDWCLWKLYQKNGSKASPFRATFLALLAKIELY